MKYSPTGVDDRPANDNTYGGCVDDRICVVIILLTVLASKVTLFDPPEPRFNGTGLFLTKCVKFERNVSEIPETLLQICSSTES